ncbi:T9SS type A sorting domain-containing protein [Aestuariivivens sp. NBU2969]|uniref:T9SS type A sorting domain-containing protein n=1 Tax=Aestuariivivens sp. NBU2969 TaxID=2873267 RepID=UPI001CC162F4|nr:T9SS type A sorting domain-containing protein [Aestuariivivens sp. NBU2969]
MTKITRLCLILAILFLFNGIVNATNTNNANNSKNSSSTSTEIQRVRIYFTSPNGIIRYLLLGFTSDDSASDGFDFGYDALNRDDLPDDLNWMIDDDRYLIQGVGAFDDNKQYPLGMFLKNDGNIKIDLQELENFETPINVYIYDSLYETYTKINKATFTENMTNGEYLDRFFIAFKDNSSALAKNSLSTTDESIEYAQINYLRSTKELFVKTSDGSNINKITVYNINGQKLYSKNNLRDNLIKTNLLNLNSNHAIVTVESDDGKMSTKQLIIN